MKNFVLEILTKKQLPSEKFNALLSAFISSEGNANLIRNYNARGYTPQGLESLEYDVCQHLGISARDIREFKGQSAEKEQEANHREEQNSDNTSPEAQSPFIGVLREMNSEERKGFRLATSYPFLREEDCPSELKILVNDAITAFYAYRDKHSELFEEVYKDTVIENEEIYKKASEILDNFELNKEIHRELEHYAKHKEILGEHKIFQDLKLERKVSAMSVEELAKAQNNLKTYISKRKSKIKKSKDSEEIATLEKEIALLEKEKELIHERLKEK